MGDKDGLSQEEPADKRKAKRDGLQAAAAQQHLRPVSRRAETGGFQRGASSGLTAARDPVGDTLAAIAPVLVAA